MLATDYSSIKWDTHTLDPLKGRLFPKDMKHKFSVISGIACFGTSTDASSKTLSKSGATGQIAISDSQRHAVCIFNSDGSLSHVVGEVGQSGPKNGFFRGPKSINTSTQADPVLIVADEANHRLQAFQSTGKTFKAKWQAHPHEIKRGTQPGEFSNPCGVAFTTPATQVEVSKNAAAIGFAEHTSWKSDGLDYGSDDDYNEQQKKEQGPAETIVKGKNPDLVVADTQNNRIQYISDNSLYPALSFGFLGDKFVPAPVPGQMNAPEGVAFHDGWSDWEADKSPACAEYRETLKNSPPYYRGPAPRMKVYEEMLESGKVGCFAIIETAQNNIWRMLHVTPDSYRKNEVAEVLIKTRDNTFFAQGDGRNDGDTPKFYKSLQDLVEDATDKDYLGLDEATALCDCRHYCRIAVADTGFNRVQIVGFIKPTYDTRSDFLLTLFPPKFKVLNILGGGSKAARGGKCHLNTPNSIAYNKHGDLIVNDSGHWRVCIFAPDGEMVHTIGNRVELSGGIGKPQVCNFGRDLVGNESVLVGYTSGVAVNYTVPPKVIKGDFSHLPRDATLSAFQYLDFRGAAQAAQSCRLFNQIFKMLRARWELYPLSPSVLMRIKQIFVDWSCVGEQTRIKDHLRTSDPYRGENERGNSVEWWMENYFKKGPAKEKKTNLSLQIEAQNRKRDKENLEKERIGSGGCKYKAEELNLELVRNCGKIKDLLEMIRAMELKFFLESDWRWKVLMEDEITDGDTLARRKEHFVKFLLMTYMKPPVEEGKIRKSKSVVDFDNGVRCAICDLCGLPFWWNHERVLKVLFEGMAREADAVVYEEVRTRACEGMRNEVTEKRKVMDFDVFLDFMTIVQEKNMGLRDWVSNVNIKEWKRAGGGREGRSLPLPRAKEQMPKIMMKNAVFDYQVKSAVTLIDKLFARGSGEGSCIFPELKVRGEVVFNEVEDDELARWDRFR